MYIDIPFIGSSMLTVFISFKGFIMFCAIYFDTARIKKISVVIVVNLGIVGKTDNNETEEIELPSKDTDITSMSRKNSQVEETN